MSASTPIRSLSPPRPLPLAPHAEVGFSLGGLIKKGVGLIAKTAINVVPQLKPLGIAYDAVKGLQAASKASPAVARVLNTQLLPSVGMGAPPSGVRMSAPNLPALTGGGVVKGGGVFSDVRAGGSSTAPGGYYSGGTRGHWKKDGTWSDRRRPRMNPMNVRAARKAVTRINAAEKLFRRILRVSAPQLATRRITPKRSKRA